MTINFRYKHHVLNLPIFSSNEEKECERKTREREREREREGERGREMKIEGDMAMSRIMRNEAPFNCHFN